MTNQELDQMTLSGLNDLLYHVQAAINGFSDKDWGQTIQDLQIVRQYADRSITSVENRHRRARLRI